MRSLPNIEKSAFHRGIYVGYATYLGVPRVYTIRHDTGDIHSKKGAWRAYTYGAPMLFQKTLSAMSDSLSKLE